MERLKRCKQQMPCTTCGATKGWWSPLTAHSMIFCDAEGDVIEERIFASKKKYCTACNSDIKECITPNV